MRASEQFPALLLTGARQTGKTSLLRRLIPRADYRSFDLPSLAAQAEGSPHEFLGQFSGKVILDEVQNVPSLLRYVKAAVDERRHEMGRFLFTGSQKFVLMKSLSESMAGRSAIIELETLSGEEIISALGRSAPSPSEFIWRGGFPELYRNPDLSAAEFYHSYVAAYLERDVRALIKVGSLRDYERFLRACALRSGNLLNLSDLARDIGIAATTARDWISVLEASNQLVLLEPYFNNPTKRMIKTPKLYLTDTGLLCFLLGIDSPYMLATSPLKGAIWETFVFNQMRRAIARDGSAAQLYFWRDTQGLEIDFVIEAAGRLRLIEAKWAEAADSRSSEAISKIARELGDRAAGDHLVACQTPVDYPLATAPEIKAVNAYTYFDWVGN